MIWTLQPAENLSDQQFDLWSKLLEDRAGITISNSQKSFLQTQVNMRMRELGHSNYSDYFEQVVSGVEGVLEWSILIDRLVVKETNFFRHLPSLDFIRCYLQDKIDRQELNESFDIWSVGCATGEEPYSLTMYVNECFEFARREPYFGVTATDISRVALSVAKSGLYSARKVDFVLPALRNKYFKKAEKDLFQIDSQLRDKVCFNQANILKVNDMPLMNFDAIFCQNVLIYFRKELRVEVLNALAKRLKPGGVLVIGLGEIVDWKHPLMKRIPNEHIQAYSQIQS